MHKTREIFAVLGCVVALAFLPSSFYWCLRLFVGLFVRLAVYSPVRPSVFLPPVRLGCHMRLLLLSLVRSVLTRPAPPLPDHSILSPVVLASLNHAPPHAPLPPPRPCSRTHHRPRTSPAPARRVSGERASFLKLCVLLNALCSTAPRRKPG